MVERGYPQIARPRDIQLGPGDWHAGGVGVEVTITDRKGSKGRYLYTLAAEEGEWRVAGVNGGPDTGPGSQPGAPPPSAEPPEQAPRPAPTRGGSA
jgi:hypothetical protein